MKLLIVTTGKNTLKWKSLPKKIETIRKALNKTPNATWEVSVEYRDIVPKVVAGRIPHEWFNDFSYPLFRQGNHFVYLHLPLLQRKALGLDTTVRGINQNDTDYVGESYGWSDENTPRDGQNMFVQNVLHEVSHELAPTTNTPDKTHEYHGANPDISGIFANYDMARWQPKYQAELKEVSRLQAILKTLQGKPQFTSPFPLHRISNPYGVRNEAFYPRTKHHIGTDYATPVGTPILAPSEGEIINTGSDKTLGNWCEFQTNGYYIYFLHQQTKPLPGKFKPGMVLGFTGNSGFTTGPHCHVEVMREPRGVVLAKINEGNFKKLTLDPATLWK